MLPQSSLWRWLCFTLRQVGWNADVPAADKLAAYFSVLLLSSQTSGSEWLDRLGLVTSSKVCSFWCLTKTQDKVASRLNKETASVTCFPQAFLIKKLQAFYILWEAMHAGYTADIAVSNVERIAVPLSIVGVGCYKSLYLGRRQNGVKLHKHSYSCTELLWFLKYLLTKIISVVFLTSDELG